MASEDEYNALLDTLKAMPEAEIKPSAMPMDVYLQEAEDLFEWAKGDSKALAAAGLKWSFAEEIPTRAGVLRHAQSIWVKDRKSREEAQQEWFETSPDAYDMRDTLLHDFRFAFRNRPDLLGRVSEVSDGGSHADMIQDLSDLSALGKANPDVLKAIKFDIKNLDDAKKTSDAMASLLARVNGERADNSASRVMRDKAFTYLREVVDEVRATGRYVFWKDENRLRGYRSAYYRKRASRQAGDSPDEDQMMFQDE
mgnify:CR=1 FL=1